MTLLNQHKELVILRLSKERAVIGAVILPARRSLKSVDWSPSKDEVFTKAGVDGSPHSLWVVREDVNTLFQARHTEHVILSPSKDEVSDEG